MQGFSGEGFRKEGKIGGGSKEKRKEGRKEERRKGRKEKVLVIFCY